MMESSKQSSMTKLRKQALVAIGFTWILNSQNDVAWLKKYDEIKLFKFCEGDCYTPWKFNEYPSLGTWVKEKNNTSW